MGSETPRPDGRTLRAWRSPPPPGVARLVCGVIVSMGGCARSPTVNILGSFFPAWLISIVTGLVLALIAWRVLIATGVAPYLTPAGLVYPCLAALLIFASWLVLFGGGRGMRGLGRLLSIAIIAGALVLAVVVIRRVVRHPQTDDATVMADVINVVPEGSGRIVELNVVDNQAVKQGDLLFVIDPRPYEFAVAHGRADVEALDAEIGLTKRRIEGQVYATAAARAAVQRADAEARSATDTYNRLAPLAQQEFVTAERLDQALAAKRSMDAALEEARRKMMQAEKDVGDLNTLRAKRDAAAAALGKAELDLSHTRVEAPFDALVVNLHTAVGQFVTPGPVPVFALVDTRNWYVLANYRESE